MCVVAIAWRAHPDFQLVVAGNRDELHARASAPMRRWADGSGLIAGQDLVSGGLWLGITEGGGFGVVTNRRSDQPMDPDARSRGRLLRDLLVGPAQDALDGFDAYNPVNIALIRDEQAGVLSNWPTARRYEAPIGFIGLSNGDIDEPSPRAEALMERLDGWLQAPADPERLFEALADETPTEATSSESVWGAAPIFMRHPIYGTRCSTVIVVDAKGRGRAMERSFGSDGRVTGEVAVPFDWP